MTLKPQHFGDCGAGVSLDYTQSLNLSQSPNPQMNLTALTFCATSGGFVLPPGRFPFFRIQPKQCHLLVSVGEGTLWTEGTSNQTIMQ